MHCSADNYNTNKSYLKILKNSDGFGLDDLVFTQIEIKKKKKNYMTLYLLIMVVTVYKPEFFP